ncbi:MAG: N-acetylmuramoyl-L-alanine amidase [Candidatus Cryptobacteroides sp.]|nr:N-acetylmuramoyl-L-alanine amidase [Bacteroidales bacterium]MDY2772958.1 N-acetylmuramoyl-L-alanine amidase [Candidatus Cryptobacteroides sp.]
MKILIDNGHGQSTPGKRSPDGRFLEFQFNRTIAKQIVDDLCDRGYDAELLVPEDDDIPLQDRCKRVNDIVAREGKQNVILISIHANAFGNGKEWTSPSGWSVYTSKGQTKADDLAEQLAKAAIKNLPQMKMRAEKSDGDLDYEENFYILKHTTCPAVLTENGFYTNKEDLAILESHEGRRAITDLHVEGIVEHLTK